MSLRVQKQIKLPSFVQGSSSDNAVSSNNCSSWDESSISYFWWDESSANSSYFDDNDEPSFEESLHPDELDVIVAHGAVCFWLFEKWQTVPNEQWAWMYLVAVDDDGVRHRLWAPRLLSTDYREYDFRNKRRPLLRPSPSRQHTPSTEESVASLVFNFIHSSDFNPGHWAWTRYYSSGYKNRELVRTCRLVCRDWAKRTPVGDPKLTVTNGVVWHRVEDEWQALPKRHWAWVFQKIEWWVERRQQDNDGWKSRDECKAWYPKLIQPMDESVRPESKEKSTLSSLIVTSKPYRTRLEPLFGPRFLQNVRDMDDRKLYRTCRLVCRDWARQFPATDPERGKLWLREGVMRYWIEGVGHILPNTCWAWTFQAAEWWAESCCTDLSRYARKACKGKRWYPKLMQPVNNPESLILPVQPHKCWRLPLPPSGQHSPQETVGSLVFDFIHSSDFNPESWKWTRDHSCGYTDRELVRTCRLVCRDWAKRAPLGDPKLTVTSCVVLRRVEDEWQALPKRHWAWVFQKLEWWVERRQQDDRKRRDECKAWYPKLIPPIDGTMLSKGKGRSNMSLPPVTKKRFRTRLEPSIGRRFLQNVRDLDYRELYRSCRLVCHEWARRYPVSKPELYNFNFSGGTMQYWLADDWHPLPNKYWAWTIEDVEWWTRYQFRTFSSRKLSKGWRPKLVQDVDESILKWQSGMDRLLLHRRNSSDTRIEDVPAAMKMIGSWTFGFICRSSLDRYSCSDEERKLGRTCRLVCRDWARQLPLGDLQLKVAEGDVWYRFEEGWQHLPTSYWAWTRQRLKWWMETSRLDNVRWKYREQCKTWYPRLIQSVNDLIQSKGKDRSMTLSSMALPAKLLCAHLEASDPLTHPSQQLVQPFGDCIGQDLSIAPFSARRHRRTTSVASALPPELFKYICNAADSRSWSFRLVCRYWNEQCTPHIFPNINIKQSPKRIRALWQFSRDPKYRFMPHVKTIERVPDYDKTTSRFPWLHLLTQTSLSVGFAWKDDRVVIKGPFGGGYRTIRSIHFGLPRSLPRSFSRGIRILDLGHIRFNRFDDLANLVCELPDLEKLLCFDARFTSLPTDLAHRRPRRCRNNLQRVYLYRMTADPAPEEQTAVPSPDLLVGLSLYLSVYNVASFFSGNEIAASIALMQLHRENDSINCVYTYDSNSRQLILGLEGGYKYSVLLYSSQGTLKVSVALDMRRGPEWKEADWQRFDNMFRTSRSQMPTVPIHAIFGFRKREKMLEFAEALQSRMPAVAGETTLHYAMESDDVLWTWCQASLDSEELRGEPEEDLEDVYPIEALGSS